MSNLCKISIVVILSFLTSCSKHKIQPFFKKVYVYKNLNPNNVSIDFYKRNSIASINITDSINIVEYPNEFDYTFSPPGHDSIVIKFFDGKKVVFKYEPNSSNWNLNPINFRIYELSQMIEGNLTTKFNTYKIDKKIYELAK